MVKKLLNISVLYSKIIRQSFQSDANGMNEYTLRAKKHIEETSTESAETPEEAFKILEEKLIQE